MRVGFYLPTCGPAATREGVRRSLRDLVPRGHLVSNARWRNGGRSPLAAGEVDGIAFRREAQQAHPLGWRYDLLICCSSSRRSRPTASNSLTITAVSFTPGMASMPASSVVLPLPRKPVSAEICRRQGRRGGQHGQVPQCCLHGTAPSALASRHLRQETIGAAGAAGACACRAPQPSSDYRSHKRSVATCARPVASAQGVGTALSSTGDADLNRSPPPANDKGHAAPVWRQAALMLIVSPLKSTRPCRQAHCEQNRKSRIRMACFPDPSPECPRPTSRS